MRKLYVATLVVVMVLGIFVTASNAEETPNEDVTPVEVEATIEDVEDTDIDVESEEVSTEDEDANIEDEEVASDEGDFVEIYLGKDDVYVFTAVYDPDADAWFLYETCRLCELTGCTETTPEEIYDRFGVKVD